MSCFNSIDIIKCGTKHFTPPKAHGKYGIKVFVDVLSQNTDYFPSNTLSSRIRAINTIDAKRAREIVEGLCVETVHPHDRPVG